MAKKKKVARKNMSGTPHINGALEDAYKSQIKNLYDNYLTSVLMAKGDKKEIESAGKRFLVGLRLATDGLEACINLSKSA